MLTINTQARVCCWRWLSTSGCSPSRSPVHRFRPWHNDPQPFACMHDAAWCHHRAVPAFLLQSCGLLQCMLHPGTPPPMVHSVLPFCSPTSRCACCAIQSTHPLRLWRSSPACLPGRRCRWRKLCSPTRPQTLTSLRPHHLHRLLLSAFTHEQQPGVLGMRNSSPPVAAAWPHAKRPLSATVLFIDLCSKLHSLTTAHSIGM